MANQKHLNILKQGAEVWNKWREEHPHIHPKLNEIEMDKISNFWLLLSEVSKKRSKTGRKFQICD